MRKLGVALLATTLLGACSGESGTATTDVVDDTTTTSAEIDVGSPVAVTGTNGDVALSEQPRAIVSLSPSATETLFAIDAGGQVVAVDDRSNHPPDAPGTDLSAVTPDVQAIASYEPDLVVLSEDNGGVIGSLEDLGIPVLQLSGLDIETLDDVYRHIEVLGAATGHPNEAAELVTEMQSGIERALISSPETVLAYYHELDPSYNTITSSTVTGHLYGLFGLENIADDAGAERSSSGHSQLSGDEIIEANPDFIFLTDCCGETPATVSDRVGWGDVTAVRSRSIVVFDDDISSRWGPRVVEFVRGIAQAIEEKNPT